MAAVMPIFKGHAPEYHLLAFEDLGPASACTALYGGVALDPSNHAILLYHQMEQIGGDGKPRPAELRPKVQPGAWPEYVEGQVDSYLGEPFLGPWG